MTAQSKLGFRPMEVRSRLLRVSHSATAPNVTLRNPHQEMADTEAGWNVMPASSSGPNPTTGQRSIYTLTRSEATKSLANRLIHSRAYILFYLGMVSLSITTVVLSLVDGCPRLPFYILEIIVNSAMIAEVGIRMVALSGAFWKSIFNWVDVAVTAFCIVTLIVIFLTPCASKEEEVFDTLILIVRNIVQFSRLLSIMRKSGTSIFARPKPIDLSRPPARDIDLEDDDYNYDEYSRPLVNNGYDVLFDAGRESSSTPRPPAPPAPRGPPAPPEDEDMWANVG